MHFFRPRFLTFFLVMHERLKERPDWISRVIVFTTVSFVLLAVLYFRDRQGWRF
ncbi:MAG: hypothetical protein HY242_14435 [Afipia sp.]|nr:hypothetical protein [Afipia sp.]